MDDFDLSDEEIKIVYKMLQLYHVSLDQHGDKNELESFYSVVNKISASTGVDFAGDL